jgi:hypothetical protein
MGDVGRLRLSASSHARGGVPVGTYDIFIFGAPAPSRFQMTF